MLARTLMPPWPKSTIWACQPVRHSWAIFKPGLAERLRQALDRYGIEATSLVVGGPGKEVWDFYQGPLTIGLVPRETRAARIAHIKRASDFAKQCGIPAVQTHCGFIPENPNDAVYRETVTAMREVAAHCKGNGQNFRYESGQETPSPWYERAIQDVGMDNQGVNFDLANLILYGKANCPEVVPKLFRVSWFLRNCEGKTQPKFVAKHRHR